MTTDPTMTRDEILTAVQEGKSLRDANLRGADLWNVNLWGADLRGADLRDANLRDANLWNADLRGADLRGADLQYANLQYADLRGADLRDANLQYANLQYANLRGANLRDANLQYAILRGVREVLSITALPSGHATLIPTPGGWQLRVGCWTGSTAELRELIAQDTGWPEAEGEQVTARRPMLAALADMCDAWAADKQHILDSVTTKWANRDLNAQLVGQRIAYVDQVGRVHDAGIVTECRSVNDVVTLTTQKQLPEYCIPQRWLVGIQDIEERP